MAEKTVATSHGQAPAREGERTRAPERHLVPPVDIYDTPEGLVLLADLPGVATEDLEVRVDNNVLTFQAKATHAAPGEALSREYELSNFFRQFELSEEVDQERISAQLTHGVLALHLPRVEKPKPQKIAVQVS